MDNIWNLFKKISTASPSPTLPVTHIIAGLGNPGKEYENTRHNAGFAALDGLAESMGVKVSDAKFESLCVRTELAGKGVLLMKPQTYMNLSGKAIGAAASFFKVPPENIVVLCDDISFEAGHMRIRKKGSAGGHNGLKSIIASLASDAFVRIKIGVGAKPTPEYDLAAWVLGRMPDDDQKNLCALFPKINSAIKLILEGKVDEAMSRYSG